MLSFLGVFGAESSASYVNSRKKEWIDTNKSLNDQLNELNSYHQNDIEWSIQGNKLIPKSMRVSLMKKASFSQTFVFSRIRKELYEAPFKRKFSLYLWRSLKSASYLIETSEELKKLELNQKELENKLNEVYGLFSKSLKNQNDIIQKYNLLKENFDYNSDLVKKMEINLINLENNLESLNATRILVDSGYWYLENIKNKVSLTEKFNFRVNFTTSPNVVWHITYIDEWLKKSHAFIIDIKTLTEKYFELFLESWSNTNIVSLRIKWLALGY